MPEEVRKDAWNYKSQLGAETRVKPEIGLELPLFPWRAHWGKAEIGKAESRKGTMGQKLKR